MTTKERTESSALGLAVACALALVAALLSPARAEPGGSPGARAAPSLDGGADVASFDDGGADDAGGEEPAGGGDANDVDAARASFDDAPSDAVLVHGLDSLPGGAKVPEKLRPPGATPSDGGPSPVIFPPQALGVRFDHRRHVALGATCTTCHDGAKTSRRSADSLIPKGSRCDACHGSNHRAVPVTAGKTAPGRCGYCHVGYRDEDGQRVARIVVPPPNLRFDHAVHVGRGMDCSACHGAVGSLELATVDQLPRMRACLSCHRAEHPKAGSPSRACPTCHLTERGSRLRTTFATGKLMPPAWLNDAEHGPDFVERHQRSAANDSRFCGSCHAEHFCTDCHDGRVRPRRVHPNDFLSQHPVAARSNSPSCRSCHQEQSFCLGCHQRSGVTLSGPLGNIAGRGRFHPPKSIWSNSVRGPGHHAWEAQRNLDACVSCHVERDCAVCHATAAVGGAGVRSPHPPGFASRCGRALRQNARPCLVCHDPSDPTLGICR